MGLRPVLRFRKDLCGSTISIPLSGVMGLRLALVAALALVGAAPISIPLSGVMGLRLNTDRGQNRDLNHFNPVIRGDGAAPSWGTPATP